MSTNRDFKKKLLNLCFVSLILIFLFFLYFCVNHFFPKFTFVCVFKKITGLNCPGCGITRMLFSFIRLNFVEGFKYNIFLAFTFPLVFCGLAYCCYNYVVGKKEGKIFNFSCFVYIGLLLIWGVVRNIIGV